ncbi:MAG: phosphohistidine phosphatase SixA [Candidatus Thermoplasmatota archaeon]|nr:phosphohistidine phosphatase SixA [Candidatus Thermoplasmatota archaeon]
MKLYLVRHADPKSEAEDPERSLSELGEQQADRIGKFALNAGVRVNQIRHSGKKRAEQTAEIIGRHLSPPKGVVAVTGIAPMDDVVPVAEMLASEEDDVMLVGHLPFMNRLVSQLVFGIPDCAAVDFPKAGMVCLIRETGGWTIDWFVNPSLLP